MKLTYDFLNKRNIFNENSQVYYNRICFSFLPISRNLVVKQDYSLYKKEYIKLHKDSEYKTALKKFQYMKLPIHWKIFFLSIRYNMILVHFIMTKIMVKIKKT
jgi:hypothetical protein